MPKPNNIYDVETIIATIEDLNDVIAQLRKGKLWSAYRVIGIAKHRLFNVQESLSLRSPRVAMAWGNGIRMPDGKIGIVLSSSMTSITSRGLK